MYRGLEPHQLMPMTGVPKRATKSPAAEVPPISPLYVR